MKITITQDTVDCGTRKIVEEVKLDKYNDFECFTFSSFVKQLREKLDKDVYLRIHLINNFTFDKESTLTEEERMEKEQDMEDSQYRKRNSYLNMLTSFTNMHSIPTQNIDLMNVHEKNVHIQNRVEELQKRAKDFMFKNLKLNHKYEREKKLLNKRIATMSEELGFKEKKCDALMEFIENELQKYSEELKKAWEKGRRVGRQESCASFKNEVVVNKAEAEVSITEDNAIKDEEQ